MTNDDACRVLCVDDNRDVAESTAELLELVGFNSRCCFDGYEALAVAAAFLPHACLLDINMPRMDGYRLAELLRSLLGRVPLIAVTAAVGDEHERKMAEAGFDLQLDKPAEPGVLLAALRELIRRHSRVECPPAAEN